MSHEPWRFDEQFNYVSSNFGVMQVQPGTEKQALIAPEQLVSKNGYLFVYVSNESPQDVYFDDLTVRHFTGPLVEEKSYYPFGLVMGAISSRAQLKSKTPYAFNAGSEWEENGVEYYHTFFRKYDAQIGRFTGVDILAEFYITGSPYNYSGNNPVLYNDPNGDALTLNNGRMQKGPDGNYHVGWVNEILWNKIGFFDWGVSNTDEGFGGQGSGSGHYYNFKGLSSDAVLEQMSFGDRFGINKSGNYGFWSRYNFDPRIAGDGHENLAGVGVGVKWTQLGDLQGAINIKVLIVERGVNRWNDVGHTALEVGGKVYGYYPTGSIIRSKGVMRILTRGQFDAKYKTDGFTEYTLRITQNQASSIETKLNDYLTSPGTYSIFGMHCTNVISNVLTESGVNLQNYHYNHGDPGPAPISTWLLTPNGFGTILNHSINSSIVTGHQYFGL